jgi:hypothetical protein
MSLEDSPVSDMSSAESLPCADSADDSFLGRFFLGESLFFGFCEDQEKR